MSKTKKITLGIAAGALALGAGMGVTGMATAATTPSPSATSSTDAGTAPADHAGKPGGHGHGRDGGKIASQLATKLGVDEAKVTEALKAFREANKPATPPAEGSEGTKPDRTAQEAALAKSLATALGVDEAKVTSALEEIRTAGQAERAAALKTRLDKAVSDGKLTQAEADAVTKAVEAGVIGGGGER
ncbi:MULTISPECIES: Clp protease N-terminal domain-containing protein [unclassified Arthrobacter]|uniref:Clp protease N-terminal domain-containing protein n=1 Tax=unclassified Arthrobacter TaxID=235627 RepID=UPI00254C004F|nr:Clp protease N-terminal domain-containing protein [Arthrobacter sp. fls2-241-R2A-172]